MDLITPELTRAMDSLTKRYNKDGIDKWGGSYISIDEVLPPTAWQLAVFQDFRNRVNKASKEREGRLVKEIRSELHKRGLKKTEEQVRYLYDVGMSSYRISVILKVSKSTCDRYIIKYRRETGRAESGQHNTLIYSDALALIRSNKMEEDNEIFRYGNGGYRNYANRAVND